MSHILHLQNNIRALWYVACHYNDSNKEVGEDKVAQEEECNGEELTTTEPVAT